MWRTLSCGPCTRAEQQLSRISERFDQGDRREALSLARRLRAEMIEDAPTDPVLLGWARFYEYRSLYELGEHRQAYELLTAEEPQRWALSTKNAAYMYSVGAELAMHLGDADEVVHWGGRCLDLRLADGDRVSAAQCAQTVCTLFGRLERDDLKVRFAEHLLELGRLATARAQRWRCSAQGTSITKVCSSLPQSFWTTRVNG